MKPTIAITLSLALLPAAALADDLRIDSLSILAEAGLRLNSASTVTPFAVDSQQTVNANALLAPPTVLALARDGTPASPPPGLSFASAQLANTAFYSDRISVVNNYPDTTPNLHVGQGTRFDVSVRTEYALSVSALVPDAPLDLTVVINAARLRAEDYYGAGQFTLGLQSKLAISVDQGPLQTVWQHDATLSLQATPGDLFTFQSAATVDPQGIGQPAWTFERQQIFFLLGAQATAPLFTGHLDFGLLQPGHSFQLFYTSSLSATGVLQYPGAGSFIDMELIDPLTLGGAAPQAPITLAGLTLPSAVPEPAPWLLLGGGLLLATWRRRRRWLAALALGATGSASATPGLPLQPVFFNARSVGANATNFNAQSAAFRAGGGSFTYGETLSSSTSAGSWQGSWQTTYEAYGGASPEVRLTNVARWTSTHDPVMAGSPANVSEFIAFEIDTIQPLPASITRVPLELPLRVSLLATTLPPGHAGTTSASILASVWRTDVTGPGIDTIFQAAACENTVALTCRGSHYEFDGVVGFDAPVNVANRLTLDLGAGVGSTGPGAEDIDSYLHGVIDPLPRLPSGPVPASYGLPEGARWSDYVSLRFSPNLYAVAQAPVPEPPALALLLAGAGWLALRRRPAR